MSTTYAIQLTKTVDGQTVTKDLGRRDEKLSAEERRQYGAEGWENVVTTTETLTVTGPDGAPMEQ
jgi:hypothetical protein